MTNKIYSFLGLATKAGKLVSGEDVCERAIKSEKTQLVIVADDASQNTKKRFLDICSYRNIEIRFFGSKELIGRHAGKEIRSVVAVLGREFAAKLREMIDSCSLENGGGQIGKG